MGFALFDVSQIYDCIIVIIKNIPMAARKIFPMKSRLMYRMDGCGVGWEKSANIKKDHLVVPVATCQGLFNQNHIFFRPIFS